MYTYIGISKSQSTGGDVGGSDTGGYKSDRGGERGGYFGRGHRLSAQ